MIRVFAVLLCVSLSFSVFIFSASASGIESNSEDIYVDLMPFVYNSYDGNSREVNSSVTFFNFSLPFSMSFGYLDVVLKCDFVPQVSSAGSGLTVISLGNDLYRCYGSVDIEWVRSLQLEIYYNTAPPLPSSVTILSFNGLCISESTYMVPATLYVTATAFTNPGGSISYVPGGNAVRVNFGGGSTVLPHEFAHWQSYISISDWRGYDYLDVIFYGGASTLNSVHASYADGAVPFSISYLNSGSSDWYTTSNHYMVDGVASMPSFNEFGGVIRLDLTGLDRTTSGNIHVNFEGEASYYYAANYMTLLRVNGVVSTGLSDEAVSSSLLISIRDQLRNIWTSDNSHFNFFERVLNSIDLTLGAIRTAISDGFDNIAVRMLALHTDIKTFWDNHMLSLKDFLTDLLNPDRFDITEQGEQVQDQIDSIESVEEEAFADIDDNSSVVLGSITSVGTYATPIAFCSGILQGTFNGLGDYQTVILLPLALGAFFFICSRAPGSMTRPRGSYQRETPKSDLTVEGGKD